MAKQLLVDIIIIFQSSKGPLAFIVIPFHHQFMQLTLNKESIMGKKHNYALKYLVGECFVDFVINKGIHTSNFHENLGQNASLA